jgi:hypothetical protein
MRRFLTEEMETSRVTEGRMSSEHGDGPYGAFLFGHLRIIANGADFPESEGWEHVSVSCEDRCPTWAEMQLVKEQFWTDDETAVQFHPSKSNYINHHPYCLHLWRNKDNLFQTPPKWMIGPKK